MKIKAAKIREAGSKEDVRHAAVSQSVSQSAGSDSVTVARSHSAASSQLILTEALCVSTATAAPCWSGVSQRARRDWLTADLCFWHKSGK